VVGGGKDREEEPPFREVPGPRANIKNEVMRAAAPFRFSRLKV